MARTHRTLFLHATLLLIQCYSVLASFRNAEGNCRSIEAAFNLPGQDGGASFFLSRAEYIEYNFGLNCEDKVGPITELGLDSQLHQSAAAFETTDGRVVFLKGCDYSIYTPTDAATLSFNDTGTNLTGLPCDPDAALTTATSIEVFKGCHIWRYDQDNSTFQVSDENLSERGLPCGLNAAMRWRGDDEAIYIKGSQFWRETRDSDSRVVTGPFHTDELNICSWYLCGEATWMNSRNRGRLSCNGDSRLCPLRLDQVTLPGLHNTGAGFQGGFLFADCWVRNHARSVLEQLQAGIRHLDIDPSYDLCGLLGSHHSNFCGGSICRIIKETRQFLRDNPHEVITLNFNHEIQDPEKVFPALTRQLETQLGRMLNNKFRRSRHRAWPTLHRAIRTNRRVFAIYADMVERDQYRRLYYRRHKWIHTEYWLGSTWREVPVSNNCSAIVNVTDTRCRVRKHRELVEVSIVPVPTGILSCVDYLADLCSYYLHDSLKACQPHRFGVGKSPNILLVDYPENFADGARSVYRAVFHQNVRNIHQHRPRVCPVKVDAAVPRSSQSDQILFFVGANVVIYSHSENMQVDQTQIPGVFNVDSAYLASNGSIIVTKGCEMVSLDAVSLQPFSRNWTMMTSCSNGQDAALGYNSSVYRFHGCDMTRGDGGSSVTLSRVHLPCDVDAAFTFGQRTFIFKGGRYWVRAVGSSHYSVGGQTLDWSIDALQCSG